MAFLLCMVMVVTFWGVLDRFVFKLGSIWVEELARYTSVWAAFVGAGLGVKTGAHIGVEAFVVILPERYQKWLSLIANLVGLVFCVGVVCICFDFLPKLYMSKQLSPAIRIPVWWAYASVPAGCVLMAFHYIIKIILPFYNRMENFGVSK